MKKVTLQLAVVVAASSLAACSTWNDWGSNTPSEKSQREMKQNQSGQANQGPVSNPAAQNAVGGHAAREMDSIDRSKLWHALDKPIGKSTTWTNGNTSMSYTVVPTEKITVNGNTFCRRYQVTATPMGGSSRLTTGTACVGADGNWEAVGG